MNFLPFKEVWNDFVFLDDGKIIGGIKISSLNLSLLFDEEQKVKVAQLKKILNTIDYSIKIFSLDKPVNLDKNLNTLGAKIKAEKNVFKQKLLEEDYTYIQFLNSQKAVVNREFYLIVEETADNEKLLKQKLNGLLQEFNSIGLTSTLISSEDWRELLYVILNPVTSIDSFKNDGTTIFRTFKERIAPSSLKINERDFVFGDAFMSIITLRNYPSLVDVGWLGAVANVDHTRMTITISPMNTQEISTTLKKSMSEVKSKMINVSNYNDQILLSNQMDDYVELVNRIDREHEKFCLLTVNFLCYGESREDLNKTKKELKSMLASYGLGGSDLMFEQERSFKMLYAP